MCVRACVCVCIHAYVCVCVFMQTCAEIGLQILGRPGLKSGATANRTANKAKKQKRAQPPPQEPAPQHPVTIVLRGKSWDKATSGKVPFPASSVVRVIVQHKLDERRSEWLDSHVQVDRAAYVFCALHAHMRLTEALVKDMFGRAIESGKVPQLREAFKTHLNIQDRFVRNEGKRGWKKVSLYGYECWRFARDSGVQGQSAIERVIREVWGEGHEILTKNDMTNRTNPKEFCADAHNRFLVSYCSLWRDFNKVMQLTRCKTFCPELLDYGALCRDLGSRWCLLLPRNRCGAFYLHTLTMHGGDFMNFCLERGLTVGMLENSGAERRHEIGRVQFKKSLSGGGKAYQGMKAKENRSAYLTLRGLLIWQYGRDYLALQAALAEFERRRNGPPKADRSRAGDGWEHVEAKVTDRMHQLRASQGETQHKHDEELGISGILCEDALDSLERAMEGEAPPDSLIGHSVTLPGAEDSNFSYNDGTTIDLESGEAEGCESDSENGSNCSSMSGSGSESDLESDSYSDDNDE